MLSNKNSFHYPWKSLSLNIIIISWLSAWQICSELATHAIPSPAKCKWWTHLRASTTFTYLKRPRCLQNKYPFTLKRKLSTLATWTFIYTVCNCAKQLSNLSPNCGREKQHVGDPITKVQGEGDWEDSSEKEELNELSAAFVENTLILWSS